VATHTFKPNIQFPLIDFVKIKINNPKIISYLWSHSLLYFHSENEILLDDKEVIHTKQKRQYKGILFELTDYVLYVYFKPHYYYNNNIHNANDFSVINCIRVLKEFVNTFDLDAKELKIVNIEIGLNIVIPKTLINVQDLLFLLIFHELNEFYTDRKHPFCKFSSRINSKGVANVYKIIKCYDKGVQFPLYTDRNTFRFEVKSNRKKYIEKLEIFTLNDLLNIDNYNLLAETILKEFDKVLIIDEDAEPNLSKTKLKNHRKKLNPINWRKFLNKSRNVFNTNFKQYERDLNTCQTHLKKEVRILMYNKMLELKKCAYLTLYKGKQCTLLYNQCLVTGLNISMQKIDSILLSHTGLRYYLKTDIKIYNEVKSKYLSYKWVDADTETEIKEIAHNIRNKSYNCKNKQKRIYTPKQYQLFEVAV
jgi:hypothetical protein